MKKYISVLLFLLFSMSAYALPLPSNLIALNSAKGQQIFSESQHKQSYWGLSQYFVTENGLTYCAIAANVMTLNVLLSKKPVALQHAPYHLFTQTNFFTKAVLRITTPPMVNFHGTTLDQSARTLRTFGLKVTRYYGNQLSVTQFRRLASRTVSSKHRIIILNLSRKGLDEQGGGHFSPLAAYDQKTDRFLLMDVARYKYPPVWVKTADLVAAIDTKDSGSKKYRGILIVSK